MPGLTGSPDERGAKRVKKDWPARATRVRRGMIQLARRFLMFQKDSALAEWYRQRTTNAPSARKLLIALWRLARDGVVPEGVRAASRCLIEETG
jgi:transposase